MLKLAHMQIPYLPKDYRLRMTHTEREHVERLARTLRGKKILHISAADTEGRAADCIRDLISFEHQRGLQSFWRVLTVGAPFFSIAKKLYHELHKLTEDEWRLYLEQSKDIAYAIAGIPTDVLVTHDLELMVAGCLADTHAKKIYSMHAPFSPNSRTYGPRLLSYQERYHVSFIDSASYEPVKCVEDAWLISQNMLGYLELYAHVLK